MDKSDYNNRAAWYETGERKEREFCALLVDEYGIAAEINPDKARDKTLPDLIVAGELADLKTQHTPFYKAREIAGIDPARLVSLNLKDALRYREHWPRLWLYFWVEWPESSREIGDTLYRVRAVRGVYRARMEQIDAMILRHRVQLRGLLRRQDGEGGAKNQYHLSLDWGFMELPRKEW